MDPLALNSFGGHMCVCISAGVCVCLRESEMNYEHAQKQSFFVRHGTCQKWKEEQKFKV